MEDEDEELAELRKRRMQALQQQQANMEAVQEEQKAVEDQRQAILRTVLTPEARERLGRVKTAHPELAAQVEQQLIMLASSGRLAQKIDDETMRQVLAKMMPRKKEITITRRRLTKNDL